MDTEELIAQNKRVGNDFHLLMDKLKMLNDADFKVMCEKLNIPYTNNVWSLASTLQSYYWSEVDWAVRASGRSLN